MSESVILLRTVYEKSLLSIIAIAKPSLSIPLLPALPAIWKYSFEFKNRKPVPSNFRSDSKTTVFAGILIPTAKVSVV